MKTLGLLVALYIGLVVHSFGATIWEFGQGGISRQTLTNNTHGFYSMPLMGVSGEPLYFNNGEAYLGAQAGLTGAYVWGVGNAAADATNPNGVDFTPTGIVVGLDAGGGMFAQAPDSGTYIGHGFLGLCAFAPQDFGSLGLALNQEFNEPFSPQLMVLFVGSFDVANGLGFVKW